MNNTHFAISNTDNYPFAVIRKGKRKPEEIAEAIKNAIEEETGDEVEQVVIDGLDIDNITMDGYQFTVVMRDDNEIYYMHPTWEY